MNEDRKLPAADYDQISELYLENTELIIESHSKGFTEFSD